MLWLDGSYNSERTRPNPAFQIVKSLEDFAVENTWKMKLLPDWMLPLNLRNKVYRLLCWDQNLAESLKCKSRF